MRRTFAVVVSLLMLTAAFIATSSRPAEARRGGAIAAGILAGVIGGVIVHHALRGQYRRRHYYSGPVYYRAGPAYYHYGPRQRIYSYRPVRHYKVYRHKPRRCIRHRGYRYCR